MVDQSAMASEPTGKDDGYAASITSDNTQDRITLTKALHPFRQDVVGNRRKGSGSVTLCSDFGKGS